MQPSVTSGTFWQQLVRSGLLTSERTSNAARELRKRSINDDAQVAEFLVDKGLLTQYQADRLLEGRSRGFFFDGYRVLDLLGAGGMGWVYRAADTSTEEVVALKVLLDRLKEDRGMLARFQQEARAGLLLNHPNIVRTRATGSAGGMLYMILDFVEGPSLLELLLKRRRLPWGLACDFARQAALGLHHAHLKGLVHRDVKPQNLLIDSQGNVKVLDFGLAMMRDGEGGDEFSMAMIFGHECIGTPAFMAPEQARDSLMADARSDVYGLGCTLYAALVGDTPFPYSNPHDVVKAHQTQPARSVQEKDPRIPDGVAQVVAKMLAKNPDDRFESAVAAADALAEWSQPGPVDFDFPRILAERSKNARDRVSDLHKSRPSGAASSTTRLGRLSSVAKSSERHATFGEGRNPQSLLPDRNAPADGPRQPPSIVDRQILVVQGTDQPQSGNISHLGKMLTPVDGGPPIRLIQDRIVIGRGKDCDLQIMDAAISSRHCELTFDGICWWATDLKSRNGTAVNGKPTSRRQLVDNDVLLLANAVRLKFHDARKESVDNPTPATRSSMGMAAIVIAVLIGAAMALVWLRS